jgi:trypsin-like peptidase/TIR domain-containing protein
MTGKIFISYRRNDESGNAGRLRDLLVNRFGPERLFFDVDSIELGADFLKVIREQVAQSEVLITVIGPRWVDMRHENGPRRLDDKEDPVRIEIETALDRDKRIIPVLIGDARMPAGKELPESLKPLAMRSATRLTHERFLYDCEPLIAALSKIVGPTVEVGPRSTARAQDRIFARRAFSRPVLGVSLVIAVGLVLLIKPDTAIRLLDTIVEPAGIEFIKEFPYLTKRVSPTPAMLTYESLCRLVVDQKFGTCFIINATGFTLAPANLFDQSSTGSIFVSDMRQSYHAERLRTDRGLALVKIDGRELKSVRLSNAPLKVGDPVSVISADDSPGHFVLSSRVVATSQTDFFLNGLLASGQSGSPVFNQAGEVVAVALDSINGSTRIVPISQLGPLLPVGIQIN